MRHLKRTAKLGRTFEHRNAMLANLVCSLIKHRRVTTTLAKAKAARSVAENMVTLGKSGTREDRRLAASRLRQQARTLFKSKDKREHWRKHDDVVRILFDDIAPMYKDRPGGYTRILKLGQRPGDSAQLAILEWVEQNTGEAVTAAPVAEPKPKKASKKSEAKAKAEESPAAEPAAEPKAEEAAPSEEKKEGEGDKA